MGKYEIIEQIARERMVETFVEKASRSSLTADLKDLCQLVYVVLLEYNEDKIVDLWEHGEIQYFVARIIMNQLWSKTSTYYYQIRKYAERAEDITGLIDIPGE